MSIRNAVSIRRSGAIAVAGSSTSSVNPGFTQVRYDITNGSGGIQSSGNKGYFDGNSLYADAWGQRQIPIGAAPGSAVLDSIRISSTSSPGKILGLYSFKVSYGDTTIAAGSNPVQPAVGGEMAVEIDPVFNPLTQPDFYSGRICYISDASGNGYGSYEIVSGIESSPSTATNLVLRRRDISGLFVSPEDISAVEVSGPETPPASTIPSGAIVTGRSQLRRPPPGATYCSVVFSSKYQIIFDSITLRQTDQLIWHGQRGVGMSFGPRNLLGDEYAQYFVDSNEVNLSTLGGDMSEAMLAEFLAYTTGDQYICASVTWYDGEIQ